MHPDSTPNSDIAPTLLHYGHHNPHWLREWQWTWLLAMFFGVIQIPWCIIVAIRISDLQSSRPIEFLRDSLLESWQLAFTIPAIAFSILGILSCWKTSNRGGFIFCVIIFLMSLFIIWIVGTVWYQDVFCATGRSWRFW